MGEVVRLQSKGDLEETFDEILQYEDDLTELAIIARFKNDEGKKEEFGTDYRTLYKFFGTTSSINVGGLVHHLYDLIADYIKEHTGDIYG